MSTRKPGGSRRLQTDPFIKAAAHPTRQTILKSLQENDSLTTVELQELTGEDRYNLYHHLAKLQDAGLVDYELQDSRAKQYFLKSDRDTVERFVHLDAAEAQQVERISKLLELLADLSEAALPAPEDLESISIIFRLRRS